MHTVFHSRKALFFLTVPGMALLVFSILIPICFSLYYSFTDWQGFGDFNNVGFENYIEILGGDAVFWRSLLNVFVLIVVTVALQNTAAFALAAVLARIPEKISRVFRTVYFVPAVLSLVVVCALWVNILNPTYGILNKLLHIAGLGTLAFSWLSDPATALWSVIWIMIWQGFGWALLFYYTGLVAVPKELEEAARIDGAGWFGTYTRVVIPYMFPVISAVIVIDVVSSMKQMEMVFLTTQGGPGTLTQFASVYLYQKAFTSGQYGYGNALSILLVVVSVGLTLLVQRIFRGDDEIKV